MFTSKIMGMLVLGGVLVGGCSFYGGMTYAQSKAVRGGAGRGTGTFQPGMMGRGGAGAGDARALRGGMMGGPGGAAAGVSGEVLSKDDKSFTVQLRDGGSKIVFFSTSTTVGRMATGTLSDVTNGAQVMVFGPANQDGSVTAQMVQLRERTVPAAR